MPCRAPLLVKDSCELQALFVLKTLIGAYCNESAEMAEQTTRGGCETE